MEKRLNEIGERKAELRNELENAEITEERLAEIESEVGTLEAEETEIRKKMDLRGRLKETNIMDNSNVNVAEERAQRFAQTGKMTLDTRSLLISGGTVALATKVEGQINDIYGPQVSSLVDLVNIVDCTGMGTYRVPYLSAGMSAYEETEGSAGTASDNTFGYVDLTPNDYDALGYISKQIAKQSPIMYEQKVVQCARTALRKKVSKTIVDAVVDSTLADTFTVTSTTLTPAVFKEFIMQFGGAEGYGNGTLVLTKADLIAIGAMRGTNEKKAIFEIIPDAADANRGTIKEGGFVVPYILNSNLTALSTATADATCMLYGDLRAIDLALWGGIEVKVSEDYKFAEGLLTVRGETLCDADLVVKHGFVKLCYDAE